MKSSEEFVPNERLRRARSLKGWSQTDLAERVGTSFEMVSRWERGVTVPSSYYRERLCAVLAQTPEELGLLRGHPDASAPFSSPHVFLACSYTDAGKPIVSSLKTALQEGGITPWSSRQLSREGTGNRRLTLHEIIPDAQAVLVIISPQSRSSRHAQEALELASRYQRPVYGVWIDGEHWQEYLPKGSTELSALIDARTNDEAVVIREVATALEQVGFTSPNSCKSASANLDVRALMSGYPTSSKEPQAVEATSDLTLEQPPTALRFSAGVPLLLPSASTRQQRAFSRSTAALLIALVVLVLVGSILDSASLLAHFSL